MGGSIPIYWGAPNVELYIPESVYIDARRFPSSKELVDLLLKLDEPTCQQYILEGGKFLESDQGRRFTYENVAIEVMNLFNAFLKKESKC